MTKNELVNNSFDVGFYSAYLVSDRVQVVSKHNDDELCIWDHWATDSFFTLLKDTEQAHSDLKRGTKVICYLKADQYEFLEIRRLKDIVNKQPEPIGYHVDVLPIYPPEFHEIMLRLGFVQLEMMQGRCSQSC